MAIIKRTQIKQKSVICGSPFLVEEWGGEACIRRWSGSQRANLLARISELQKNKKQTPEENIEADIQDFPMLLKIMSEIVAVSICDENGVCLYDENKDEDLKEVEDFDINLLHKLFEECAKRNGLLENQIKNEIKN